MEPASPSVRTKRISGGSGERQDEREPAGPGARTGYRGSLCGVQKCTGANAYSRQDRGGRVRICGNVCRKGAP